MGINCPQKGQPKVRTRNGQVYLADMSAMGASGIYKFDQETGSCEPIGCNSSIIKSTMMGLSHTVSDISADPTPQDWLYFWSFDVNNIDSTRVYYLSREREAPNRFTIFSCEESNTSTITTWNINLYPEAAPNLYEPKIGHGYGDIFHTGPRDNLVALLGELYTGVGGVTDTWSPTISQNADSLAGKMLSISKTNAESRQRRVVTASAIRITTG